MPIHTDFEGGARTEEMRFFGLNFPKSALKFGQIRVFLVVWESSEIQFARPEKKVDKIFKVF